MGIEKLKGHPHYLKSTDLEVQILYADPDDYDSLLFKTIPMPSDGSPKKIYRYKFGKGFITNSAIDLDYPTSISTTKLLGEQGANNPLILTGHRIVDDNCPGFGGSGAYALSLGVIENPDDPAFLEKIGEGRKPCDIY